MAGEVYLNRIYVELNEKYEVQYGGAGLGMHGQMIITTDNVNVNLGDAVFEKILSALITTPPHYF